MRNIISGAGSRKHAIGVCLGLAVSILASPAYSGYTQYDNLAEWQAAVGSFQVEDFESYPETEFPQEGGQIPLDHFTLEADGNGIDEWDTGGIYALSRPPLLPLSLGFLTTLETTCDGCGPTYNRAIFPQPITGIFVDVPWTEDGYLSLILGEDLLSGSSYDDLNHGMSFGAVFDQPLTTIGFDADHSWAFIDRLYFSSVPEPGTFTLLSVGLLGLGIMRRNRLA